MRQDADCVIPVKRVNLNFQLRDCTPEVYFSHPVLCWRTRDLTANYDSVLILLAHEN